MKNRIKVERAELNITQADLADKIGVSRQSINAIEKGKYVPSAVLALKIARLFKKQLKIFSRLKTKIKFYNKFMKIHTKTKLYSFCYPLLIINQP